MADPITPKPGATSLVATGGVPVVAVVANSLGTGGGYITNPYTAGDQGFDPNTGTPENLYVDIVTDATLSANGTTVAIYPGSTFEIPAGLTTKVSVNAATSGHKFTAVYW